MLEEQSAHYIVKFKIATKIGILAAILVLSTAIIIGKVAERETIRFNLDKEIETTYRDKLLVDKAPFVAGFVENLLLQDTLLQADREVNSFVILSHLADPTGESLREIETQNARERPWEWRWKEKLGYLWKDYLQTKEEYLGICFTDRNGKELIRVQRKGDEVVIGSPGELGELKDKPFIAKTIELGETDARKEDRVFLSRIELNREGEDGEFSVPLLPVIRAAAPILTPKPGQYPGLPESLGLDETEKVFGIITITMRFDGILKRLAQVRSSDPTPQTGLEGGALPEKIRETIYVTDENGNFLCHPDHRKLFGMESDLRKKREEAGISGFKITNLFPELAPFFDPSEPTGPAEIRIRHDMNQVQCEGYFVKAHFGPKHSPNTIGLAMVAPYSYLQEKAKSGGGQIRQATIALGVINSLIAFFTLTWFLRQLKPFAVTATKIAQGDYDVPLPDNKGDEIGELAQAFGEMIKQVHEREEDLRKHKEGLEAEVQRRTEALRKAGESLAEQSEALKKTNVELAVARDRALEAGRAKSEFFAKMSHELKSPLTVIILAAESLEEEVIDLGLEEDLLGEIRDVLVAAWTLFEQITSILDISKIEAGKLEVNLSTFDVREIVEAEITRPIRYLAGKRSNKLEVHIDESVGEIHMDRTLVKNALYNLLSNACKFTENGTVSLRVFRELRDDEDWVVFAVTDTGIGLDCDQTKRIFRVFSQVDASTASKYGGHGLGLANVRNYCEIMGGSVSVESEPGKGSTFTIHLPAAVSPRKVEKQRQEVEAEYLPHVDGSKTVLVIDDDPQWRESMLRILTREGFHTVTASSGEEGLRHARQIKPAVITLDVAMPTMDGWAVLTELKNDPSLADIPVIMLTLVDNKRLGFTFGAADYLTKPVDRERLTRTLRRFVGKESSSPILLVEDDSGIRLKTRRMLEKDGWTVVEAENGRAGIKRMEEEVPALVLLDLLMPEMNGFEFIESVRKNEKWRSIPIVIVTALELTNEDLGRLNGYVEEILRKQENTEEGLLHEISELVKTFVARSEAK